MDCRERLPGEPTDPAVTSAAVTRKLFAMLLKRLPAAYRNRPEIPVTVLSAHLQSLQMLERELCRNAPEPACVRRARQYIADNLIEPLTVEIVARHVHRSPAHFSRCWNQATGVSLTAYLAWHRVDRAKALLRDTNQRIIDLSLEAGFQSAAPFYRWFRKLTGQTPTQYRRG